MFLIRSSAQIHVCVVLWIHPVQDRSREALTEEEIMDVYIFSISISSFHSAQKKKKKGFSMMAALWFDVAAIE